MKVSIIIPCKEIDSNALECIRHCRLLDYPDYEIAILPDHPPTLDPDGARVAATGEVGPSEKRDLGASLSEGALLAFIDDDAYPSREWLKWAVQRFKDDEVAAVGGPGVTPPGDDFLQRASGHVYSSPLGGGALAYRYTPREGREVDDFPSCNFIVRRSVFQELGGFNTRYWPGEDTKLCLEITHKLGKKILYDPRVLIYHHRRRLFLPHMRQVWNYGLHRGHFAKRYPETSLRLAYLLPSLLFLALPAGILLSLLDRGVLPIFIGGFSFYLLMVLLSSANRKEPMLIPLIFLGTVLTHFTYGAGFLKGLALQELER
ncbi:MAG: glycosyltransferase [Candidatus Hydrothermarchaeota archaeon]